MRLLLAAAFALASLPAFAQEIPVRDIVTGALDNYIRPSFSDFATEAAGFRDDMAALCADPGDAALSKARAGFADIVGGFARIEFIRIGPLAQGDRLERLLFWPDKKGIALRQVQQVLASAEPDAAAPATLRGKSVALQGLGALEFVLFGTGSETLATGEGAYRCQYGAAAASLVADLASTLAAEWQDPAGFSAKLLDPKPEDPDFRTPAEVLEKVASSLVFGTDIIRDQRLKPMLGAEGDSPKPRSALLWRSGLTAPLIAAEFAGLRDFFVAARFPEAVGYGDNWIPRAADVAFARAAQSAAGIKGPVEQSVADPAQRADFRDLLAVTTRLDEVIGTGLSTALGLSVGFSSLDGD